MSIISTNRAHIRWMIRADFPEVLAIENETEPVLSFRWDESVLLHALRERNVVGMVADLDHLIAGYMIYSLDKHSINILKFAVSPSCQRRGIGEAMAVKMERKLEPGRRTLITTTICERRIPAICFARAMGWRATGIVKGGYGEDDGYIFEYRIDETG